MTKETLVVGMDLAGGPDSTAAVKGVCLNREKKLLCQWPRCDCRVDLVYVTDCHIQRPNRRG